MTLRLCYRGYVRLVVGAEVTSKQCAQLQRVQLEAGVLDVLCILDRVLVHGQEHAGLRTIRLANINTLSLTSAMFFEADLDDASEVAVSSQLQALPLRPGLDGREPLAESSSPGVGAQAPSAGLKAHQLVEQPSADEMEELREELYGEGGVNPAVAQKEHGVHQSVQQHLCNRSQVRRGAHEPGASGKMTGRVSDVTAASWKRAVLLRMDQESSEMNHQLLLQTLQQTTTGSQKHVPFRSKLLRAAPLRLKARTRAYL